MYLFEICVIHKKYLFILFKKFKCRCHLWRQFLFKKSIFHFSKKRFLFFSTTTKYHLLKWISFPKPTLTDSIKATGSLARWQNLLFYFFERKTLFCSQNNAKSSLIKLCWESIKFLRKEKQLKLNQPIIYLLAVETQKVFRLSKQISQILLYGDNTSKIKNYLFLRLQRSRSSFSVNL